MLSLLRKGEEQVGTLWGEGRRSRETSHYAGQGRVGEVWKVSRLGVKHACSACPGELGPVQTAHLLRLGPSSRLGAVEWRKSKRVGSILSVKRGKLPRALPRGRALRVCILH